MSVVNIALLAALTMPNTDFFRFAGREHSGGPVAQAKVTSDITLSVGPRSAWLCQIARFSGRTRPRLGPAPVEEFALSHIALESPPCRLFEFTPSRTGIHSGRTRGQDRTACRTRRARRR